MTTDIKQVPAIPSPEMFVERGGGISVPAYAYLSELRSTLSEVSELLTAVEGATETNTENVADLLNAEPVVGAHYTDVQEAAAGASAGSTGHVLCTFEDVTPASADSRLLFEFVGWMTHFYDGSGGPGGYAIRIYDAENNTVVDELASGYFPTGYFFLHLSKIITGVTGPKTYYLQLNTLDNDSQYYVVGTDATGVRSIVKLTEYF